MCLMEMYNAHLDSQALVSDRGHSFKPARAQSTDRLGKPTLCAGYKIWIEMCYKIC